MVKIETLSNRNKIIPGTTISTADDIYLHNKPIITVWHKNGKMIRKHTM